MQGMTEERLQTFFGAYGRVERVWTDPTRPFVFLTYATEDEAMLARTSIEAMQLHSEGSDGMICAYARRIGLEPRCVRDG
jgi:hypothetical protein